jgi:hypothetical protein
MYAQEIGLGRGWVSDREKFRDGLTAPIVGEMTTKKDIKAHSPRYSTNVGLVASMKAGAASIAVAMPALKAYFKSLCLSLAPRAQSDCFARPMDVSLERAGV